MKRFESKINKTEGCWNWAGCKSKRGYGYFRLNGKLERAHRVSYFMSQGKEIDKNVFVLHKCDNPSCVNPSHLFEGSQSDNMKDMANKKRNVTVGYGRRTHCIRGHEFTEDNTLFRSDAGRSCRACTRLRTKVMTVRGPYQNTIGRPLTRKSTQL